MSRLRYGDVIVEMSDLAAGILDDIRQQTTYYRASVYKEEALNTIERRVDHLAFLARILRSDSLADCVHDYRAASEHARNAPKKNFLDEDYQQLQIAECSVSMRVMRLLLDAGKVIESLRASARDRVEPSHAKQVVTTISRHRRDLIAMSREGTGTWTFLHSL
jgi:hypothetical protein